MEEKRLLPENDQQELWELHGRVYAALEYLKIQEFPNRKVLVAMLGGDDDGLFMQSGSEN